MSIRAKTKRRLLILTACTLLVIVLIAGLAMFRLQQREQQAQEQHRLGMAAMERKDYVEAIEHLAPYTRRDRTDAEAAYKYAVARSNVEAPQYRHIREAIQLYLNVLEIDRNHEQAQRDLIELYVLVQRDVEVIEMADRLLETYPEDVTLMRQKMVSLLRLRRLEEALAVAERAIELKPLHLPTHERMLQILTRLDRPDAELIAWAEEYREAYPDEPQFDVLLGFAWAVTGDREQAVERLKAAATRDLKEPELMVRTVSLLADTGEFVASQELLERCVAEVEDDQLVRMLARRLWEGNRHDDLRTLLSDIDTTSPETDSALLAFKAATQLREGESEDAQASIALLKEREGDNTAAAWALILEEVLASENKSAHEIIEVCREAIATSPNLPYVRVYLAEALSRIGETELAIDEWKAATQLSRTWATPHLRLAQTFNATGRHSEALAHAQAARHRAPNSLPAAVTLSEVLAELVKRDDADSQNVEALISLLQAIQEGAPGQHRTIATYAAVLAQQGESEKAITVIREALDGDAELGEDVLLQLAEVSREHDLGITDEILQRSESEHGISANLAYAQAISLHAAGQTSQARQQMRQQREAQGQDDLSWDLAYARFLDVINDSEAASAWKKLARENPENINLQRTVLGVQSIQQDRDLLDETITRVRELGGDEGLTWRMARARWLLSGSDDESGAAEAIELLEEVVRNSPNIVEPRLLLATAMQQAGDRVGAIEQLTLVSSMQPNNMQVALERARMEMQGGRYDSARRMISQVLENPATSRAERRTAANLLAQLGDPEQAIALLSESGEAGQGEATSDLLLAELHLRRNQPEQAAQVYQRLMQDDPSAAVIQAYANLLGAQGRHDEAGEVLAVAEELGLTDGVIAMLRAEYVRQYGSADRAIEYYREALAADPENASVWRRLVDFYLDRGEVDQAIEVSADAGKALPDNRVFALFVQQAELVRLAGSHDQVRPLVSAMLHDEEHRDVALEALQILQRAEEQEEAFTNVTSEVRRLADRYPRFLALQNLSVDLYLVVREYNNALAVAERAMQNFPNRPDPAQRATRILATQGAWERVLRFASDWRERELYRPLPADVAIAEAHLNLGDHQAALQQIDAYLESAREQPNQAFPIINIYARAMVAAGRIAEASDLLQPLLPDDNAWRDLWISLAMRLNDADEIAAWLEAVEEAIPAEGANEQANLASNWYGLGQRFDSNDYRQHALSILEQASSRADAPAGVHVTHGVIAYQEGDLATAESQYRTALNRDEDHAIALNNLAMLLADREAALDEALALAERAVEATESNVASFLDTIAHVQMQRGDYADAIVHLEEAVRLEPRTIEWRVNLVRAYHRQGRRDQALAALEELDGLQPDAQNLAPSLRDRLQQLREELTETQTAAP
ncbi:MAG: tetratricopeptide repeat protein [Phycisphaeraceae bacterium]